MRRRGYTVVEVMMALAVLTLSAIGVAAMQKASVVGNAAARDLTIAQNVASTWLERLRTDAVQWTNRNPLSLNNTTWLQIVGNDYPNIAGQEAQWFRPGVNVFGVSPEADVRGYDIFDGQDVALCTHIRLEQIQPNMIRADVRVFWKRRGVSATDPNIPTQLKTSPFCSDGAYIGAVSNPFAREYLHFVHMSSGILRNELE